MKLKILNVAVLLSLFAVGVNPLLSRDMGTGRYALILSDPPASERFASRAAMQSVEARNYTQQLEQRQAAVRRELTTRKFVVTASVQTLLNAVFVVASPQREAELHTIPGVKAVVPLRRYEKSLNAATQLVNGPAAWNALGGVTKAGQGIKIAVIDSGIDQTHPAFQDDSLPTPAGFPVTGDSQFPSEPNFTNKKVIVARSFVSMLAAGSDPANPAADSRADDYSARDRDGHGTAVASAAAAVPNTGPGVTFNGMAPKAYLGNYKIFGSPSVNNFSSDDVIIKAIEDAQADGMDIASLSLGGPAFTAPLAKGADCGNPTGVFCDLLASTVENAVKTGMLVVVAAGNAGDSGLSVPTLNTISSPADAPSAIAVGGTTNSHEFGASVLISGAGVPSDLQNIFAVPGDGPLPSGSVSAPLRDVTKLGDDGFGCAAFPAGSLNGVFALIERGPGGSTTSCPFATKVKNAENAGAAGVILYMQDSASPIAPGGLTDTNIPTFMISNASGVSLKTFLAANPDRSATLDPNASELSAVSTENQLVSFSSLGPSLGDNAVKPEIVAPATNMYMAAENFDPSGDVYSPNRYAVANGTSFATPLVSGAAALVKQAHGAFTPTQIKSALVNTANGTVVTVDDSGNPVGVREFGAGLLDAGSAISTTVTFAPTTASFGALNGATLPVSLPSPIQILNSGTSAVNLTFTVAASTNDANAHVTVTPSTIAVPAGGTGSVSVSLTGTMPTAGAYQGFINITGGPAPLHIPYMYLVGDGVAANLIPLSGSSFDATVNQNIPDGILSLQLIDKYGVPVANAPVTFKVLTGRGLESGATLQQADNHTDQYGIAAAVPLLGSTPGVYAFSVSAGGQSYEYDGTARLQPTISDGGVVNGASFETGKAIAPGSYISIFGNGLADNTDQAKYLPLPFGLGLGIVNVSFDVPSAHLSIPGNLLYVSPTQINLQVPWELQGQNSVQVKVTIDYSPGNVITVPLSNYSPGFFETAPGIAAALDEGNKVVTASNGVARGHVVQLFVNGLGPVNNQPKSGVGAGANATTTTQPIVTIGGQTASISYSGLAPGFPGLYQINAVVPSGIATGTQTLTLSIGGVTAKNSGLPVK